MKKNIIENAKLMINTAQGDFFFSPDTDQKPRFIQAFLLQAGVVEGLVREFCDDLNKKNRIDGVKKVRTFNQAVREARVSGGMNKKDFNKLTTYIDFRNNLVHRLIEKDIFLLENEINLKYKEGSEIINTLLEKDS